ncbi:MAG TPA: hypothetical protein VM554_03680 [Acidisarcina sp.]|nr:hypothetical protein [Acidisarcina sp.]
MNSSRMITLFAELPVARRGPSSFVISMLLHGVVVGLVALGLRHMPRVDDRPIAERYSMRLMNLRWEEPQIRRAAAGGGVAYPGRRALAHAIASSGGMSPASASQELAPLIAAPQTLVQPDVPPNLLLPKENPLPSVLVWSPENSPVKRIIPPPPQEAMVTNVRPAFIRPNHEVNLADVKISPTAFVTERLTLPPSTTSPIVIRGPELPRQVPQTASKPAEPPTPARVMSLSDLQVREGMIALPLANQVTPATSLGVLGPGRLHGSAQAGSGDSQSGNGNQASKQNGTGAGQGSGDKGESLAADGGSGGNTGANSGKGQGSGQGRNQGLGSDAGSGTGSNAGGNAGSSAGGGLGSGPSVSRITVSKDGKFGVVVVGSSLAERYPETVGLWGGRLAYTVYLHVGLNKSWILQYAVPRAAEAAAAGNVVRPDAPWPYDIVRPNLTENDFNAEAIMVHGIVSLAGRFEQLSVLFPAEFAQAKFVIDSLRQWQFKPAMQNGQAAAVEVLLIIPEQTE